MDRVARIEPPIYVTVYITQAAVEATPALAARMFRIAVPQHRKQINIAT
jgi:hypothetical protein